MQLGRVLLASHEYYRRLLCLEAVSGNSTSVQSYVGRQGPNRSV